MNQKEELALLLNYLFCDKPNHLNLLLETFTSIDDFRNGFDDYLAQSSMMVKTQLVYKNRLEHFDLKKYIDQLQTHEIRFILKGSEFYPHQLAHIYDPPGLLFYKGNLELLKNPILGVVGSRHFSAYGKSVTQFLVKGVLDRLTICSGLARGIDSIAHQTALENGKGTISVVATGLDQIYPAENKPLFKDIVAKGLVLSEYPVGTEPLAFRFPQRNRIISGLSKGVLVAEAALQSGSLITAHLALEYGRDVFCVPGNIFSEGSFGIHQLIQEGAKLVSRPNDILQEYFSDLRDSSKNEKNSNTYDHLTLNQAQRSIINAISSEPLTLDELAAKTHETVQGLLESITLLEIGNIVSQDDKKRYFLVE